MVGRGNRGLVLLALFLLLSVYLLHFYPGEGSDADTLTLFSAASLVEHTTLDVAQMERDIGIRARDVTRSAESVYPSRPPGFALIAAPFYSVARLMFGPLQKGNIQYIWFTLRITLSSLPLLLLAFWLFSSDIGTFPLATLLFATPILIQSMLFTPFVFVAILVYLAFRVIYDFKRIFPGRCFTAGGFLGLAVICQLEAIVPALVFGLGLLFTERRERSRRFLFFSAGLSPFVLALVLYYGLLIGDFAVLLGEISMRIPTADRLYAILFSPSSGVFAYSPVLLLSVVAVFTTRDTDTMRFRVKYTAIVLSFITALVAATPPKYTAGPILFVIPLLLDSFFDGETDEYSDIWKGFLFTVSFLMCAIPLLTYPFPPAELGFPHNSFYQPLIFVKGVFSPTIMNSYGFGNTFLTIAPVLTALTLILFIVFRRARKPVWFLGGTIAGLLLVGSYMFSIDLENEKGRTAVQRAGEIVVKEIP